MKKFLCVISLIVAGLTLAAKDLKIPQRLELTTIEANDDKVTLEVFNMPKDGQNHYYLSVGTLGIGDDVIQFQFDPLFELFLPLGDTLDESMETLKDLQSLFKSPVGTSKEMMGCLAPAIPNDKIETVKITYRKLLLSKMLEFAIEREGYIRATHISKTDFGSLILSMKMYRKIHPKEK